MDKIEWHDIQGLVLSGYPTLPASAYLLWRFIDGRNENAKGWMTGLATRVTAAETEDSNAASDRNNLYSLKRNAGKDASAINIALTSSGLEFLGGGRNALGAFSLEFREGMAPRPDIETGMSRRSNILGDLGASSPAHWDWGGWTGEGRIDGLLLLYASNPEALERAVKSELAAMAGVAEPAITATAATHRLPVLEGRIYDDLKEHFGFTDGISQPIIEGSPRAKKLTRRPGRGSARRWADAKEQRVNLVKPGEFIIGYANERTAGPRTSERRDGFDSTSSKALMRNGTYLVFRQLEQDVPAFRQFVSNAAKHIYGQSNTTTDDELAARLVGRKSDGDPLVQSSGSAASSQNGFLYYHEDRNGMACPVGAHIRRANPRDTIGPDPDTALRISKMHRIIRRGRPYGKKYNDFVAPDKESPRGMLFIALNADIAGQFEMIQHSWLNNPRFGGMYAGTDLFGHYEQPGDVLVIQDRPANVYLDRPKAFVRVRGGAYFFMPGISALRLLGSA